ncbi:MAG: hypothetical protein A2Z25_21355 [Planctomycetes bacterium RBG_16_55_9]|nr:MAG: hypothetical protein A2Z25_21355 [Planctomycetes bacterium RBG_16_55_9]
MGERLCRSRRESKQIYTKNFLYPKWQEFRRTALESVDVRVESHNINVIQPGVRNMKNDYEDTISALYIKDKTMWIEPDNSEKKILTVADHADNISRIFAPFGPDSWG